MFDPGVPYPRRHVSTHLYVNCALTTAEFVITACGTYFVIKVWELFLYRVSQKNLKLFDLEYFQDGLFKLIVLLGGYCHTILSSLILGSYNDYDERYVVLNLDN